MFETLQQAPPDPIFGLIEAFQKDTNPEKINLSVGVFKDANGTTPILDCVKSAEQKLLNDEATKAYLGIEGHKVYGTHVQELLFGKNHPIIESNRAVTVQTPGGTGALRIAGDFMKKHGAGAKVWMTKPTWANHHAIFEAAGLEVNSFPYFDPKTNGLDFDGMLDGLKSVNPGDVVVLHGCCHNPCGVDPSLEQWKQIAEALVEQKAVPLVDFAYQGFGDGIEDDAAGLRTVCESVDEFLVASSFSKNFGLYCERVGALTAVGKTDELAKTALSNIKICIRTNYSNPPSHGASIVQTVLNDQRLRDAWGKELAAMRDRISGVRSLFVSTMKKHAPDHDFEFIKKQRGMFSFSGLSKEQVDTLKNDHSIYIVGSGRINVAGITDQNVERLCKAIASVL